MSAPYTCPAIDSDRVATPGSKDLPPGAVAARLCVSDRSATFLPPADDLRHHVEALVHVVNRQRITGSAEPGPRGPDTGCGGPSPPSFTIVFDYADGIRTISGNPLGCSADLQLQVGNGMREGSMRVWRAYLGFLAEQRQGDQPPRSPGSHGPACSGGPGAVVVSPLFEVHRVTSARLCSVDLQGHRIGAPHDLGAHQLRVLQAELVTRHSRGSAHAGAGCHTWRAPPLYAIVATDQWGDHAVLSGRCQQYGLLRAVPRIHIPTFHLRTATTRMLRRARAAPITCPSPAAAVPTPGLTSLPHGATGARICYAENGLRWLPPAGILSRGAPALARLVNAAHVRRAQQDRACNADLGPAYAIVFRYPDGTRTITGDTAGCREIVVGSTERGGGRPLFHAYLAALARQRVGTDPHGRRPHVEACVPNRIPPFSPLSDPAHLADARVCPARDGGGGGPAYASHGRRLDPHGVAALRHDLATAGRRAIELRPGAHYCRSPIVRGPLRVTAVDRWGDRFVVDVTCDLYRLPAPHGHHELTVHLLPATARALTHR